MPRIPQLLSLLQTRIIFKYSTRMAWPYVSLYYNSHSPRIAPHMLLRLLNYPSPHSLNSQAHIRDDTRVPAPTLQSHHPSPATRTLFTLQRSQLFRGRPSPPRSIIPARCRARTSTLYTPSCRSPRSPRRAAAAGARAQTLPARAAREEKRNG